MRSSASPGGCPSWRRSTPISTDSRAGSRSSRRARLARMAEATSIAPASGRRLVHALLLPVALAAPTFGAMAALGIRPFAHTPLSFLLVGIAAVLRAGGVVGLGLVKLGGVSLREVGWRAQSPLRAIALGVVGFAGITAALAAILAAFGALDVGVVTDSIANHAPKDRLLFLCFGIEAGFTEETVFRGFLQPALASQLGLARGIVAQAAMFSLYHVPRGPIPLLTRFAFGLVL